ncbi:MAG: DUF4381 domain-containing protein [Alsobacter sp.]
MAADLPPGAPLAMRLNGLRLPPPLHEGVLGIDLEGMLLALGAGAVLALVLAAAVLAWRTRRRRFYAGLVREAAQAEDPGQRLAGLAALLRRVSLTRPDGPGGSRLSGEPWLAWLDERTGSTFFREGAGRIFGDALYRPAADADWAVLGRELPRLLAGLQGGRRGLPS